jgi:WD40 repeat protein
LEKIKYHKTLAFYFAGKSIYLNEPDQKNPNTRKLVEQPWQQTKVAILEENSDTWDLVTKTLCDLHFIEAKCIAGMTFVLIDDYNFVLDHIPENLYRIKLEKQQTEKIDYWTSRNIEYSRICSELGTGSFMSKIVNKPEPKLPDPPLSCSIWTQEEIDNENKRISENPTRLDKLSAFLDFISKEFQSLNELNEYSDFTIQHAYNYAPEGFVHNSAGVLLPNIKNPILLSDWHEKECLNSNPSLIKTIEGHNAWITCLDMTPNGRFIVTSCYDSSIRVWDAKYGKCIKEINPKGNPVTDINITPDCRLAISSTNDGSSNGILQLWDLESGNCLQILRGHTSKISSVSITPDGTLAVSSSSDKTIRVWDLLNGNCVHVLKDEANSVYITYDGRKAISASGPSIKIWDITKGKLIKCIEAGERSYFGNKMAAKFDKIKITPDGKTAVTSNNSFPRCMVWDLEKEICLKEVGINGGGNLSITSDAKYAMFAGSGPMPSRNPFVMDLTSGEVIRIFEGHTEGVNDVCISPTNKFGVSVSNDKTIKIWNIEKGNSPSDNKVKYHSPIRKMIISSNNSSIFSQTDFDICIWDLDTGQFLKETKISLLKGRTKTSIDSFDITPDNKHFITTFKFSDNNIYIWDHEGETLLHELKGHTGEINSIRIAPDSNLLISESQNDHSLRAWDISSGACRWIIEGVNDKSGIFNISIDNLYLFYISDHKILKILNATNGKIIGCFELKYVNAVYYNYGEIILNDKPDIRFSLLKVGDGYAIRDLNKNFYISTIGKIKLTADCRFAFYSDVYSLTMWELATGICVNKFDYQCKKAIFSGLGVNPLFHDFIISPDDQYIISFNNDLSVRLWETKSGKCLAAERINSWSSIAFSMAKQKIIIGTWLEELRIFNLCGLDVSFNQ